MRCKMRRSAATIIFLFLVKLTSEPVLQAQNSVSTGIINGRVENASGAIVTDAIVVPANASNGYKQSSVSNGDGLFAFSAVPAGVYTLEASAPGFRSVQVTDVNASVGQTTGVTVKLSES
jgi:hypothetical protein